MYIQRYKYTHTHTHTHTNTYTHSTHMHELTRIHSLTILYLPFLSISHTRHLSTTSFEDLSIADSNHTAHSEMPRPISDHKKTLSVTEMRDRTLYTSAENLQGLESIGEQEKNTKRPASNIERTSSCINLASDYEKHPEKKRYVS